MKKKTSKTKSKVKPNKLIPADFDADPLPQIIVLKYKENKDGSASVEFACNDAFIELYKKDTKKKIATVAGVGKYITDLLEKSIEKQDGYDIKEQKNNKTRKSKTNNL